MPDSWHTELSTLQRVLLGELNMQAANEQWSALSGGESADPTDSISVVLATYNGERYLSEQLESLATQIVLPAELVIGDDGSTDRTVDILKDFAKFSPFPVHLFRQGERLGYGANFLAMARKAVSPLLAFCDQDDIWHPEKLLRVRQAFGRSAEVLLVAHQTQLVTADGMPISGRMTFRSHPARCYPLGTLPLPQYPGFSLSTRRELLRHLGPDVPDHLIGLLGHDGWLWIMASCVAESVILPDFLVSHRQHDTNTIVTPREFRQYLHVILKTDVEKYAYLSSAEACTADYLNRLGVRWEEEDHSDRAAAARSRSVFFYQRAQVARAREALYCSADRRAAVSQLAHLIRSRSYERPTSAAKDALRLVLGPTL